ncbi:MAG: tyrosine-type recombinase/integrase [Nitrososphaeraceae archaeon]
MQKQTFIPSKSYDLLLAHIRNQKTKKMYKSYFKMFLEYCQMNPDDIIKLESRQLTTLARNFLLNSSKRVSPGSIHIMQAVLKLFFEVNEVVVNWTLIRKAIPKNQTVIDDRLYTQEEIRKLLDHADLREKTIIYTLLSTGMRIGGLCELELKDLQYIEDHKLYKITVYASSKHDRYITFCTPECATTIQKYLEYRKEEGEKLEGNTGLIGRNIDPSKKSQKIRQQSLHTIMNRLIQEKSKLFKKPENVTTATRYPVMRCHGFRKIFNTKCIEARINYNIKEMLMGHKTSLGLDRNYYRPSDSELLDEYIKVVDSVTINEENKLRRENTKLKKELDFTDREIAMMKQSLRTMATQMGLDLDKLDADFIEKHPG